MHCGAFKDDGVDGGGAGLSLLSRYFSHSFLLFLPMLSLTFLDCRLLFLLLFFNFFPKRESVLVRYTVLAL